MPAKRIEVRRTFSDHAPTIRVTVRRGLDARVARILSDGFRFASELARSVRRLFLSRVYLTLD